MEEETVQLITALIRTSKALSWQLKVVDNRTGTSGFLCLALSGSITEVQWGSLKKCNLSLAA